VNAPIRMRPEVWATGDAASELRQVEFDLDRLDSWIAAERRVQVTRTRALLSDLGFDVSGYDLPPYPHPLQQRTRSHPDEFQLAQAIVQRRVAARGKRDYPSDATFSSADAMTSSYRLLLPREQMTASLARRNMFTGTSSAAWAATRVDVTQAMDGRTW
jgi:hypothetical protein